MIKEIDLAIQPQFINDNEKIKSIAAKKIKINANEVTAIQIIRKSIDSRKSPVFRLKINVYINESIQEKNQFPIYKNVSKSKKKIIIVGSGPAGMFAALKCLELGVKPIVLERGKDVQTRRRDLREIQQNGIVNPNSNYCFGEGGAGTYSDGKLYTRSTKKGDVKKILNVLNFHGAQNEILVDAHPHIGSNILPKVVQEIRNTIINNGGEYRFNSLVTDFILNEKEIIGVIVNNDEEIFGESVILATGHSARDIYYLLDKHNIEMEKKEFAVGVRVEHPQELIDSIQYHSANRHENLPASSYALTCQADDRGVYSFCMCPGGIIIPASTEKMGLVLNGMSVSRRDSKFANSGMVVTIKENDLVNFKNHGVFAGIEFQKEIEEKAFSAGGGKHRAPAQRITDFINKKMSSSLPDTSYIPGTNSSLMNEILPKSISKRLRYGLKIFGRRMKGFITEEAQFLAAETRTSSPIRIPRDRESLMHTKIKGLFPSGEGAGYAGGIISAAIDGENCANAAIKYLSKLK